MAQLATFKVPRIDNEPNVGGISQSWGHWTRLLIKDNTQKHYAPGSAERKALRSAVDKLRSEAKNGDIQVPCVVDGQEVRCRSHNQTTR